MKNSRQPGIIGSSALAVLMICGCKTSAPTKTTAEAPKSAFPARPAVAAPPFTVFHWDGLHYTLITKDDATDDEVKAILWELHDAAHGHTFDALHLSQASVDARKPIVWFHVYRGSKCASEKYTEGKLPCEASYHGAGDYTLGAYKNPMWESAVIYRSDAAHAEVPLWDPDAPEKAHP